MWTLLRRLFHRKLETSSEAPVKQEKQLSRANSAIVRAMISAMKSSSATGRVRRQSFERELSHFDKTLREAGERYLAEKGLMSGSSEYVGLSRNFFNCSQCISAQIAEDWHQQSKCASGQSLKLDGYCGKVCLGFVPKCLEFEFREGWIEGVA